MIQKLLKIIVLGLFSETYLGSKLCWMSISAGTWIPVSQNMNGIAKLIAKFDNLQ